MDLAKLKTDQTLEAEGVWIQWDDSELLIAALNNPRFKEASRKHLRPYKNIIQTVGQDKIPQADMDAVNIRIWADSILLGWKGLTMDGVEIPYSKEKAVELLTEISRFRDVVLMEANRIDNFQKAAVEEAQKN